MLYTDRIKNLVAACPHLTRAWIKTGDPRQPLKGVWMDEAKLNQAAKEAPAGDGENQTAELAEDHLAWAG